MPSPSSSLATLRPDLAGSFTEFDLFADREGYIASRVLPFIEVAKPAGKFGRIPLEQLLKERETLRAPGGGYSRSNFTFQDEAFVCKENGAEEPVDDREAQMYNEYFDAEMVAAERARHSVLMNLEKRVAALVFNTTTWTGSALTTAVATKWDVPATAVPITNVLAAKKKVWDGCGLWPNALIITRRTFLDLRECAQVVDRIKYSGLHDPTSKGITLAVLAEVFDLEFILVAGGAKDNKPEGQAREIKSIWDNTMAMICRIATGSDVREPCIGRSFHWSEDGSQVGGTVESYRDESVRSDIIRVRNDTDEKILYKEAGHLLTAVA